MRDPWRWIACAVFLAPAGLGQAQAPRFDVVSIREVPPNAPVVMRDIHFTPVQPGGQYVDSRTSLQFMIDFAYNVKNPAFALEGLPKWAQETSFAVAAKPAEGFPLLGAAENAERVRQMLKATLEERFHLQIHTETRQGPVYSMQVAKGGVRLKEGEAPVPPDQGDPVLMAIGDSGGRMIGRKSTMAGMASSLVIFMMRPVRDETGLKGYYDFDVKWSAPEAQRASNALGADGIALMLSNLESQVGLKLVKDTGPVEYWVVDHVERPAEN